MIMSCSCGRVASGPMPESQAHAANPTPTATITAPTTTGTDTERAPRFARLRRTTATAPSTAVATRSATGPNGSPTGATTAATTPATATDPPGASATMSSPGRTDTAASSTDPGT